MKYIFKRGDRCWHIVSHYHPASTTGAEMFCGTRIIVRDFYGHGFKDGLFRHKDVVQAIKAVPLVDPETLERLYPPSPEGDLRGPLCEECRCAFQRSEDANPAWADNVGAMREILMAETAPPVA